MNTKEYRGGPVLYSGLLNSVPGKSRVVSLPTHLKQGSDFVPLQIWLNPGLLWGRHGETAAALWSSSAGWNHEVSRCHSSFKSKTKKKEGTAGLPLRLGYGNRKKRLRGGEKKGPREVSPQWVCSASSTVWVAEQAAPSPAHSAGTQPRDQSQFVASLADWSGSLFLTSQWRGGSADRLQILRSTGCCCCCCCRLLLSPSAATPIKPPACVIHPARGAKYSHVRSGTCAHRLEQVWLVRG